VSLFTGGCIFGHDIDVGIMNERVLCGSRAWEIAMKALSVDQKFVLIYDGVGRSAPWPFSVRAIVLKQHTYMKWRVVYTCTWYGAPGNIENLAYNYPE
jgi:hypothetical protein